MTYFILGLVFILPLTLMASLYILKKTPKLTRETTETIAYFVFLLPLPLYLFLFLPVIAKKEINEKNIQLAECLKDETKFKSVEGVIRKASLGYYIYNGHWMFLENGCKRSATGGRCARNRPVVIKLEANIGKPAVVKFCNKVAVEYLIAGIRYKASGM